MENRPAVLVDVDGVLNPNLCGKTRSICKCHPTWRGFVAKLSREERYWLKVNPEHGGLLTELAEATGAELIWASYWQGHANTWVSPKVGLPQTLPFVPIPACSGSQYTVGEWKAHWVADWAKGRPFVWFDDEPDVPGALNGLADQKGLGAYRVITVDPEFGLIGEHVEEAKEWLKALPSAPPTSP